MERVPEAGLHRAGGRAHQDQPLTFVIQTSPDSRKCEKLFSTGTARASLVVGTTENNEKKDITLQLDGVAHVLGMDDPLIQTYLTKFLKKDEEYEGDIFVAITPTWWRFTQWSTPQGTVIHTS